MKAWSISPRVNSPKNNDPDLTNLAKGSALDIPMCAARTSQREQNSRYAAHNGLNWQQSRNSAASPWTTSDALKRCRSGIWKVATCFAYVNDKLVPHALDEIVKDDFAALRQMLN
jgi:hypothetical protein